MCEIWQSVSLYTSLLSINQQSKLTKMSELGGGSLKASKLTKITYKTYLKFFAYIFIAILCNIAQNLRG